MQKRFPEWVNTQVLVKAIKMREDGIQLIGKLQKAQKQEDLSMLYLQFYMKL